LVDSVRGQLIELLHCENENDELNCEEFARFPGEFYSFALPPEAKQDRGGSKEVCGGAGANFAKKCNEVEVFELNLTTQTNSLAKRMMSAAKRQKTEAKVLSLAFCLWFILLQQTGGPGLKSLSPALLLHTIKFLDHSNQQTVATANHVLHVCLAICS
jgi:hypothetical protein